MNLDRFLGDREATWSELEAQLRRARSRPERLGADGVRRLGTLYREAAADLAYARRAFPGDPVVARLERSVGAGRAAIYEAGDRRMSAWRFLTRGYWQIVREQPWALILAWALLLAPAVLAWAWALSDPGGAVGLVPGQFAGAADPPAGGRGLSGGTAAEFSSGVFTNNVQVALVAFAAGVTAGIGTALSLVFNGIVLGAVGGLAAGAGNLRAFVDLVTPHGVLELSCIVVAGAGGMRLGRALVEPGRGSRRAAFVAEGRRAVLMALGTVPWLAICGVVEGFAQPDALGLGGVLAMGFGLGAIFWALVLWRGRPTGEHAAWP